MEGTSHVARRTSHVARRASHVVRTLACCFAFAGLLAAETTRMSAPAERAIEQVSEAELRRHVETLAADDLEGRGLGTRGNERAAQYAADQLRLGGAAPAVEGYFQPFEVYKPRVGEGARLLVESPTGVVTRVTDATDLCPLPPSGEQTVAGPIVFAGHGIVSARWRVDDYKNVSARGAIVLVRDSAPPSLWALPFAAEAEKRELGSLSHKVAQARARGAAGLLVIRESADSARGLWDTPEWLAVPADAEQHIAATAISDRAADPILKALKRNATLTASLTPGVVVEPVVVNNVLGLVNGREASAAGMVVVGAHLDHDGTDEGGRVFNGADDNASGSAAVLAIAAAFARAAAAGERPARPVVFALWNGEEQGSLGAEHFVSAPRPARRVIANINLDMVGRSEHVPDPDDPRFHGFGRTSASRNANVVHLLGYSYSPDLARLVNRANEAVRLKVKQEYDRGAQRLVQRSDQWSFLKRGIPAIFLTTGLHPDYHTPADDPDRIDYRKLERIAELAARVAWMAADGAPPRFER